MSIDDLNQKKTEIQETLQTNIENQNTLKKERQRLESLRSQLQAELHLNGENLDQLKLEEGQIRGMARQLETEISVAKIAMTTNSDEVVNSNLEENLDLIFKNEFTLTLTKYLLHNLEDPIFVDKVLAISSYTPESIEYKKINFYLTALIRLIKSYKSHNYNLEELKQVVKNSLDESLEDGFEIGYSSIDENYVKISLNSLKTAALQDNSDNYSWLKI